MELSTEIQRQLQLGAATTAGAIAGVVVAEKMGWDKTITIAVGSVLGIVGALSLGVIKKRD